MCESTAYVVKGEEEEILLKDVVHIQPLPGGKLLVENLLGDQREFKGSISEIDFLGHRILLKES